jgi:hypothetical protein
MDGWMDEWVDGKILPTCKEWERSWPLGKIWSNVTTVRLTDRSIDRSALLLSFLGCCFVGKENSFLTKKGLSNVRESPFCFSHFEFLGFPDHQ